MDYKKFADVLSDFSLQIQEEIQRPFQWTEEKRIEFFEKIIANSKKHFLDPDEFKCLDDFGSIMLFKRKYNTNISYYLDNGGHRIMISIICIRAISDVISENGLADDKRFRYQLLDDMANDAIKNVIPHRQDEDVYREIMSHYEVSNKNKELYLAYEEAKSIFSSLLDLNEEDFVNVCEFLTKHFSFYLEKNQYCSINTRKNKYNQVNNLSQEQKPLHRAFSTMDENACECGDEDFIQRRKNAVDWFNANFKDKDPSNNKYLGHYVHLKLLSESGNLLQNEHDNTVVLSMKLGHTNKEYQINAYKNLFNENDIKLYYGLTKNLLTFGPMVSQDDIIGEILLSSLMDIFSDRGKARNFYGAITFRILSSVVTVDDSYTLHVKDGFSKWKILNLLKEFHMFRFYSLNTKSKGGDERSCLVNIVRKNRQITSNEDLDFYYDFFHLVSERIISLYDYQTSIFSGLTKSSKGTQFMLFFVSGSGNNMEDMTFDIATKLKIRKSFDVDHVIPAENKENELFKDSDLDCFGNLRILRSRKNRGDKNISETREIDFVDNSFPESMMNREFTKDDILPRQKWMSDKIRSINDYLYNYEFKKN